MALRSLCMLMLVLASAPALAQEEEETGPRRHVSPTPAWLPRGAFLGSLYRSGVITPQLRAQWEYTVIQERVDALVLLAELGGGQAVTLTESAGVSRDIRMTRFYQYSALFGVAYRGTQANGVHLGAHVGVGPLYYGARFEGLRPEHYWVGTLEGRGQIGYEFLKGVVAGVTAGYNSPWGAPPRSFARDFLGGAVFGLFVDWR